MSSENRHTGMDPDTAEVTVGTYLKTLRQQQGLTISQVSLETHISTSNLNAIEAEEYEKLPADTFTRGLVTIYAEFLDIDGPRAAKDFLQQRDAQLPRGRRNRQAAAGRSLRPKKLAEPSHVSSATVAALLLILIVASFSAFCIYTGWNPFAYFLKDKTPTPAPLGTVIEHPPVENDGNSLSR
jgi:cytoskeletal protein RodZ